MPLTDLSRRDRVVSNLRVDAVLSAAEVESAGGRCIQVSTDDVMGLAADVRVREAAIGAIRKFGLHPGPSTRLRDELQSRLARHLNVEAAVVLPNVSLLDSLPGRVAVEPRTGRRLEVMASELLTFEDPVVSNHRVFVIDALHPFEGDIAPLNRWLERAQAEQSTVVAVEAHGLGVLGHTGGGVAEHLGVAGHADLHLLSLASLGGGRAWVLAGTTPLIDAMQSFAVEAPSVASMAATLRALEILQTEPQRRSRVFDVAQRLIDAFRDRGLDTGPCVTPWVPVWVGDEALTLQWLRGLAEAGVATRALLAGNRSRLLFSVAATISDSQVGSVLDAIERIARKAPIRDTQARRVKVTLARPGSFLMAAQCDPKWLESQPEEETGDLPENELGRSISNRVFDVVETLTWRAANLRSAKLPGTDALRALIDRTRNRRS